jgi:hypothetical protein
MAAAIGPVVNVRLIAARMAACRSHPLATLA